MYSARVKALAYRIDPECWISYSGKPRSFKGLMDSRRNASLKIAERRAAKFPIRFRRKPEVPMPPLKIAMLLHFSCRLDAYPENQTSSYVRFVQELLDQSMIERPTHEERARHVHWAYKATIKGHVYVEALKRVPLPVRAGPPTWIMPDAAQNPRS
jgi:hypothetical protein